VLRRLVCMRSCQPSTLVWSLWACLEGGGCNPIDLLQLDGAGSASFRQAPAPLNGYKRLRPPSMVSMSRRWRVRTPCTACLNVEPQGVIGSRLVLKSTHVFLGI
jgi:hypothetical protein